MTHFLRKNPSWLKYEILVSDERSFKKNCRSLRIFQHTRRRCTRAQLRELHKAHTYRGLSENSIKNCEHRTTEKVEERDIDTSYLLHNVE